MGKERRQHPRYRIDMDVVLHVGGGGLSHHARTWDLSKNGIFVLLDRPVASGARVDMAITDEARKETLFLSGQVVHVSAGRGLGILFSPLSARADGKLAQLLAHLATVQEPT